MAYQWICEYQLRQVKKKLCIIETYELEFELGWRLLKGVLNFYLEYISFNKRFHKFYILFKK